MSELDTRNAVIEACRGMNRAGLNQGTSGNVSVRAGNGFLITPSGVDYDQMQAEQIVPMDLEGGYWGDWLPSSEWRMHMDIYRAYAAAGAVVHVHSTYATALSCLRRDIPAFHYMIAAAGGDSLRCADYAMFGTQELSDAMLVALAGRSACLLANHGQICFGADLAKALWLAGEIEALCQQYFIACQGHLASNSGSWLLLSGGDTRHHPHKMRDGPFRACPCCWFLSTSTGARMRGKHGVLS